jgi:hypothetical protein
MLKNGKKDYGTDKIAGNRRSSQSISPDWSCTWAAWRQYNGFLQGV